MVQTHPIFTLSTSLGSMTSTNESYSWLLTNTTRSKPQPQGLTQPKSTLDNHFHSDKDILEAMTKPEFSWDIIHHHLFFLHEKVFVPTSTPTHNIHVIESKYFLPLGMVNWFKNPIPTPDAFEEGNMSNISPTIKVNISNKPRKIEEISLGVACSLEEITGYTILFQEYRDIFTWDYFEMPGINPTIVEHHIDTWHDVYPIRQKQCQLHPSKEEAIK